MRCRSTLIAGAALLMTGAAGAADLPAKVAAPIQYVRVCSTEGSGFFYIPGTDSCLRVSGRVRADYRYVEPIDRVDDAIGFRARGRLNIDNRTMTSFGLLRTYLRFEIDQNSGAFDGLGTFSTNAKIQEAFVQFGGLTAGRVTSFFTDPNLPAPNFADLRFDDPANADVALLAYTFSFGNGLSATLSLENGLARRVNNDLDFPLFGEGALVPTFAPIGFTYGGDRVPDVVGNLRYTTSTGGAQIAGAVHQIRDVSSGLTTVNGVTVPVLNPITGLPNPTFADTKYGFAASLDAYANLPWLGTGTKLGSRQPTRMARSATSTRANRHRSGRPLPGTAQLAPGPCNWPLPMRSSIRSRATSRRTRPTGSPAAFPTSGRRRSKPTSSVRGCSSTHPGAPGMWFRSVPQPSRPEQPVRSRGSSTSTNTLLAQIRSGVRCPACSLA